MKKRNISPTYITAVTISLVCLIINLWLKYIDNGAEKGLLLGITIIFETFVLGVVGLVCLIPKGLRSIAQGILIGLGINLVIGFSVCSIY